MAWMSRYRYTCFDQLEPILSGMQSCLLGGSLCQTNSNVKDSWFCFSCLVLLESFPFYWLSLNVWLWCTVLLQVLSTGRCTLTKGWLLHHFSKFPSIPRTCGSVYFCTCGNGLLSCGYHRKAWCEHKHIRNNLKNNYSKYVLADPIVVNVHCQMHKAQVCIMYCGTKNIQNSMEA